MAVLPPRAAVSRVPHAQPRADIGGVAGRLCACPDAASWRCVARPPSLAADAPYASSRRLGASSRVAAEGTFAAGVVAATALLRAARLGGRRCPRSRARARKGISASASTSASARPVRPQQDLPTKQALGIDLRKSFAFAAIVSVTDGTVLEGTEPVKFEHKLAGIVEADQLAISETVQKIMTHFNWKGVVGCSITPGLSRFLFAKELSGSSPSHTAESDATAAAAANAFLEERWGRKCTRFHSMAAPEAAGCYALLGDAREYSRHGNLVLVCTMGGDELAAALFSGGRRVSNYPVLSKSGLKRWGLLPGPGPVVGSDEWAASADNYLVEVLQALPTLPDIDQVIIVPSGRLQEMMLEDGGGALSGEDSLLSRFPRLIEAAAGTGTEVLFSAPNVAAKIIGAARGAVAELQTSQLMEQLKPLIGHDNSLQSLSEPQIRAIFGEIDRSGDGLVQAEELFRVLDVMGVHANAESLLKELDTDHSGDVSLDEFSAWWQCNVRSASVVTLTSVDAWQRVLEETSTREGPGADLIVLEVTLTFCRSCHTFAPKYLRLARKYGNIRFVQLVGNSTIGAMEFVKNELAVVKTPSFFIFRVDGEQLAGWTGTNLEAFEEKIAECIARAPA